MLLLLALLQTQPTATRLLREPTISATQVAFAYANDIWVVGREGGQARRLTSFPGTESRPAFSPDGKWIAFTASYGGNPDVYVVPAEGGEPRRLTWHPGADVVGGWTPDGTKDPLLLGARRRAGRDRAALVGSGRGRHRDAAAAAFGGIGQPVVGWQAHRLSADREMAGRVAQLSGRTGDADLGRDPRRHGRSPRFPAR